MVVGYQKMDVIGGDDEVKNGKPIAPSGFEKPIHPYVAVSAEPEQKITLVGPVSDMPHVPGDEVASCAGHMAISIESYLT
jgi:hypothetical protein